jgi:hypothetical protein
MSVEPPAHRHSTPLWTVERSAGAPVARAALAPGPTDPLRVRAVPANDPARVWVAAARALLECVERDAAQAAWVLRPRLPALDPTAVPEPSADWPTDPDDPDRAAERLLATAVRRLDAGSTAGGVVAGGTRAGHRSGQPGPVLGLRRGGPHRPPLGHTGAEPGGTTAPPVPLSTPVWRPPR